MVFNYGLLPKHFNDAYGMVLLQVQGRGGCYQNLEWPLASGKG